MIMQKQQCRMREMMTVQEQQWRMREMVNDSAEAH